MIKLVIGGIPDEVAAKLVPGPAKDIEFTISEEVARRTADGGTLTIQLRVSRHETYFVVSAEKPKEGEQ